MKKILMIALSLFALAGCAGDFDYYNGGVRYVQDGEDCIFYSEEQGRRFSNEIRSLDTEKKIVYRNVSCETLYNRDMSEQVARHDRKIIVPAAKKSCGCKKTCTYVKVK